MALAAKGLTALIRSGSKMQLIASPKLSDEDIEAIVRGIRQRNEIIVESSTIKELEQEFDKVVTHLLACLSWLLSQKLLEIKVKLLILQDKLSLVDYFTAMVSHRYLKFC
ncbi:MAG: hypothetical protein AAGE84_22785 [Cyanobacteria bacterium P01_G01_bin.39]